MKGNTTWQRNLLNSAVAASMLFGASMAGAATQGSVGATSTGSVDLSILLPDLVLVENLDDIVLNYDRVAAANLTATETFCVWGSPGIVYDITFDSLNPTASTVFTAVSGTDTVEYTVDFDDWTVGTSFAAVTQGVTLDNGGNGYVAANSAVPGCTNDNAALRINAVAAGNLADAPAGAYTDTLTVVVAPL